MKKKSVIISFVLSLALIMGTFSTAFAAAPPTDATREAIVKAGIQCVQKITDEVSAEKIAIKFAEDVAIGGYGLASTDEVKSLLGDAVILDTMPQGWYGAHHIPGAICSQAGDRWTEDETGSFEVFSKDQRDAMLSKIKEAVGTKKVTKYQNKKTKKYITAKAYKKLSSAKKKLYKKVSVNEVNKDKTIIVYCGFVNCRRSHQAARFLVEKGFKNVFRYPGGISGWVDANNDIEGTDVEPAPAP